MCKRALNVCMEVLHVCKKGLKLVHGVFARVQKGIERCKNGLVNNLGMKLLQVVFAQ